MSLKTIVIVETQYEMRNILRHAFAARNYLTWTLPTPELVSCIFEAGHPSAILIDLDTTEGNTVALIQQWHELAPDTRIIVESEHPESEKVLEALRGGAYALLMKPYSVGQLFELLEQDFPEYKRRPARIRKVA